MPSRIAGIWVVVDVLNCGDGVIVQLTHQCVVGQAIFQALKLVALSHHVTLYVSVYIRSLIKHTTGVNDCTLVFAAEQL